MPETQWQDQMNLMVKANVTWSVDIRDFNTGQIAGDLVADARYFAHFNIKNSGPEVTFKNIQARLVPDPNHQFVQFFADSRFTQPLPRVTLDFPNVPGDGNAGNQPTQVVFFRALHHVPRPLQHLNVVLFDVGIYAEVVPTGKYWDQAK